MSRLAMIAVFTSFSISRGKIFSQKIQKFSICKNAFILGISNVQGFFSFFAKINNCKSKKLRVRGHGQQPVPTVFQYSHSCKRICRSGFLPEFLFLLSNSFWFLLSMQIAETADFLFTAKVPLSKYLDSRSLNKNIFWWPWTENT